VKKDLKPGWLLGTIAVVLAFGGTATASSLITSGKIKDGTIQARDIKKGTITADRFSQAVQAKFKTVGSPGPQGPKGDTGATGATLQGSAPKPGPQGPSGMEGAFYSVAKYNVGDTNAGAIATVACDPDNDASQKYVAVSGGVQTLALGDNGIGNNTPVSSSFPGRMDWSTNAPKPDRLDGWIVQFGGNAQTSGASDKDPRYVNVWALCVKKTADVATKTTFAEDGS
jgi:hypothetical protein